VRKYATRKDTQLVSCKLGIRKDLALHSAPAVVVGVMIVFCGISSILLALASFEIAAKRPLA
jgi:hypothetical protein